MVLCLLNGGAAEWKSSNFPSASDKTQWKRLVWFFQITGLTMSVTTVFDTGLRVIESPASQSELLVSPNNVPASLIPFFSCPAFLPSFYVSVTIFLAPRLAVDQSGFPHRSLDSAQQWFYRCIPVWAFLLYGIFKAACSHSETYF